MIYINIVVTSETEDFSLSRFGRLEVDITHVTIYLSFMWLYLLVHRLPNSPGTLR